MLIGQSGQQCKPHIITLSRSQFYAYYIAVVLNCARRLFHSAMVYHPNAFETAVTRSQTKLLYCKVPDYLFESLGLRDYQIARYAVKIYNNILIGTVSTKTNVL